MLHKLTTVVVEPDFPRDVHLHIEEIGRAGWKLVSTESLLRGRELVFYLFWQKV